MRNLHDQNGFFNGDSEAMSTEEYLRKYVFNKGEHAKNSNRQRYKPGQAITTEEFIKYDVFGAPLPEEEMAQKEREERGTAGGMEGKMLRGKHGVYNGGEQPERMIFTSSVSPQTGPEDGNGAVRDFTPDTLSVYETKSFVSPQGAAFGNMELFRDAQGRIVRRVITCGGTTHVHEYAYDQAGRLCEVSEGGSVTEQYAYGKHGERVRDGRGKRYAYDDALRLVEIQSEDALGNVSFSYDHKGQMIEKSSAHGVTRYAYNQYGALTDVMLPDGRHIHYTIDPAGRRVIKAVDGQIVEKYCWYDMVRLMGVCDGDDDNGVHFLYAKDGSGELDWLPSVMRTGGSAYGLAFDQAGALLAIADANGNVIQQNKHQSFGSELAVSTQPFVLPISFGGGLLVRDTGLIHFVYRDYDPATAHFIQPDPLGHAAGDVEVYGWCLDDPVNLVDPLGLYGQGMPGIDTGPVFDNASRFAGEFGGATMTWWDIVQEIPEPRQKGAEALARQIARAQQEKKKSSGTGGESKGSSPADSEAQGAESSEKSE